MFDEKQSIMKNNVNKYFSYSVQRRWTRSRTLLLEEKNVFFFFKKNDHVKQTIVNTVNGDGDDGVGLGCNFEQ